MKNALQYTKSEDQSEDKDSERVLVPDAPDANNAINKIDAALKLAESAPKAKMPEWVWNIYKNPCPYQAIVKRLDNIRGRTESIYSTTYDNEFVIQVYANLGITGIDVLVGKEKIQIYSTSYEGGWRDGPWWNKLSALADRLTSEKAAKEKAARQAEIDRQNAKQKAENELYSRYLNGK